MAFAARLRPFYGILAGATSYLQPHGGRGLTLDNTKLTPPEAPYYTTDAFTDYAIEFLDSNKGDGKPYFLYLAYNAPHWPLHAKQEDIDKFLGKYDAGWEKIREARFRRQAELGIVDDTWELAEWESRRWEDLTDKEREDAALRMSVYAAQVHCMDYNVGRVLDWVEKSGEKGQYADRFPLGQRRLRRAAYRDRFRHGGRHQRSQQLGGSLLRTAVGAGEQHAAAQVQGARLRGAVWPFR